MRSGRVLGAVWVLLAATACPHAFGKGGTIDRAVLKDVEEFSRPFKLTDCSAATLRRMCIPEKLQECTRQCKLALDEELREDEE